MTALSGMVQNYTQLLLARLGVGLGEAGGSPPSHSMLSDYFLRSSAAPHFHLHHGHLSRHLFWLLCGGWIADTYGWRNAFFIVASRRSLGFLLLLLVREPPRTGCQMQLKRKSELQRNHRFLLQRPAFWWIALGCSTASFVGYGTVTFFLHCSSEITTHSTEVACMGVISAPLGLGTSGGYLADRWANAISDGMSVLRFGDSYCRYRCLITLAREPLYVVLAYTPAHILNTLYLGPCIAICHTLVAPTCGQAPRLSCYSLST